MQPSTGEEPATPEKIIRIALLDDHPIVLKGLSSMFEHLHGYSVVFTAGSASEFISGLRDHALVDIVVIDLLMDGPNGFDVLQSLRAERPEISCVAFSFSAAAEHVRRALALGARAYVLKESSLGDWRWILSDVLEHGFHYTDLVSKSLAAPSDEQVGARRLDWSAIPRREREFALLLLEPGDLLYTVIAERMGVALSTVEGYSRWFSKHHGTHSRADLMGLLLRSPQG